MSNAEVGKDRFQRPTSNRFRQKHKILAISILFQIGRTRIEVEKQYGLFNVFIKNSKLVLFYLHVYFRRMVSLVLLFRPCPLKALLLMERLENTRKAFKNM